MKEYEKLQSQYNQATKSHNVTKQELQELREENAELVRQNQNMTTAMNDIATEQQKCKETVTTLNRALADLQLHHDTTVENYLQQLTGKNRDLSKTTTLLEQRTRELNEKEAAFRTREQQLQERQNELEAQEEATRQALAAKEQELENVRGAVTKALGGFADMGLKVETKEGKVYVSMEDKLLFASGSWTVSPKGVEAIKMLAQVLEENKDLNVMVEGHTDNDAYHGSTAVKDNWDLSVMRATAIVKLLLKQGPAIDPARVEACGHGEYAPRVPNTSAANKAANRRTEIILTPKLSELMNIIGQ
jgi:chemotaxis protein MotB